jgi:hypothetical protein
MLVEKRTITPESTDAALGQHHDVPLDHIHIVVPCKPYQKIRKSLAVLTPLHRRDEMLLHKRNSK